MQKAAQPGKQAGRDISTLLRAWSGDDQSTLEKLTPIVYDELHLLARHYRKWQNPAHFFDVSAAVVGGDEDTEPGYTGN